MTTTNAPILLTVKDCLKELSFFECKQKLLNSSETIILKYGDFNPLPSIKDFKEEAKLLKQKKKLSSHVSALNFLANTYGYKNFNTIKPFLYKTDNVLILDYQDIIKKLLSPSRNEKETADGFVVSIITKEMQDENRIITKTEMKSMFLCYFSILEYNAGTNELYFIEDSKKAHLLVIDIYFAFNKEYHAEDLFVFIKLFSFRSFLLSLYYLKKNNSSKKKLINNIIDFLSDEWRGGIEQKSLISNPSDEILHIIDFSKHFNEFIEDHLNIFLLKHSESKIEQRFSYIIQQNQIFQFVHFMIDLPMSKLEKLSLPDLAKS